MDDKLKLYRSWAPPDSPWSKWVKPVSFAHLPFTSFGEPAPEPPAPDLGWLAARSEAAAVILDLPGASAVRAGVQLAKLGLFQPIPLQASCPPDGPQMYAVVPTTGILLALQDAAPAVAALPTAADRRPIFLLDANRWDSNGLANMPDVFDNRAAVFPSDFPPADVLRAHGIQTGIVVRDRSAPMKDDLVIALAPWLKAAIRLEVRSTDGSLIDFTWLHTGFLSSLAFRAKVLLSLRSNPMGGFGRYVAATSGG